jgi:hypothetical protein
VRAPLSVLLWVGACAAPGAPPTWGQWIWTAEDAAIYDEISLRRPDVAAAVLVAELHYDGAVTTRLRSSPTLGGSGAGAVVRLDDSIHAVWEGRDDDAVAALLTPRLAALESMLERHGTPELQLDYDCPVRLLPRWAAVLGRLTRPGGVLAGQPVWITSLLSHLRDPRYGNLFTGKIAGHILQVFDTAEDPADPTEVSRLVNAAGLRWRLGVGAFERGHGGVAETRHREWLARATDVCAPPQCDGVWVFPGGSPWEPR